MMPPPQFFGANKFPVKNSSFPVPGRNVGQNKITVTAHFFLLFDFVCFKNWLLKLEFSVLNLRLFFLASSCSRNESSLPQLFSPLTPSCLFLFPVTPSPPICSSFSAALSISPHPCRYSSRAHSTPICTLAD
jgi:hypothetical protein